MLCFFTWWLIMEVLGLGAGAALPRLWARVGS